MLGSPIWSQTPDHKFCDYSYVQSCQDHGYFRVLFRNESLLVAISAKCQLLLCVPADSTTFLCCDAPLSSARSPAARLSESFPIPLNNLLKDSPVTWLWKGDTTAQEKWKKCYTLTKQCLLTSLLSILNTFMLLKCVACQILESLTLSLPLHEGLRQLRGMPCF